MIARLPAFSFKLRNLPFHLFQDILKFKFLNLNEKAGSRAIIAPNSALNSRLCVLSFRIVYLSQLFLIITLVPPSFFIKSQITILVKIYNLHNIF